MKKSSTETIIEALLILSKEIYSEDGVAVSCLVEAATRMKELAEEGYDKFILIGKLNDKIIELESDINDCI